MAFPSQPAIADPSPAPPARQFSILHAPFLSFFSRALYQDVAWRWPGTCLFYLFLLLAVCWVPGMVRVHVGLSRFVDKEAAKLVEQIPEITIHNGKVSIDEPEPYVITNPETGEPAAIIDTTGEITSLEGSKAHVLLTESTLTVRKSARETRTVDLSDVSDFRLDKQMVYGWLMTLKRWLVVALYPFALVFSYAYRVVQALLYALIGLAFANMLGVALSYQTSMRLAVIATTPAIILNTVHSVAGLQIPWWWLICFVLAMAYLFVAVKAGAGTPPDDAAEQADQATPSLWPPPA